MKLDGGAFVITIAGATPKRRKGLAWRSARGRRARQSSKGVFREAGRASCLLGNKDRMGSTRYTKVQDQGRAFGPWLEKTES